MGGETLREKKKKQEEREAQILRALTCRKKALADAKRESRRKKKCVGELVSLLAMQGLYGHVLRPAHQYVPKSYNLDRQLMGLINHMFVRYAVPDFMYQVCLADIATGAKGAGAPRPLLAVKDDVTRAQDIYRQWFVTLAQGGSFNKLVNGVMTSREAVTFLTAPTGRRVHENVWWAKMKVAGVPDALIPMLIDRVFTSHLPDDPDGRMAEAIQFYARQHRDLDRNSLGEVTDFVTHKLRHDTRFRLKGRTASSVIKLSNEWHLQMQRAKLGKHVGWGGLGIADWQFEDKAEVWFVTELRDNKELVNEGRKQKHCVYSYVQRCVEGRSAIFSVRACRKIAADYDTEGRPIWDREYETRRVTVEVSPSRTVVQARGPLNRAPLPEEREVLRRWAGEKGITLAARA